jgi:hypothetical protein
MRSFFMSLSLVAVVGFTSLATVGCAADSSDEAGSTDEAVSSSGLSAETTAKAKKILSQKITAFYEGEGTYGDVKEKGTPTLSATNDPNVVHATGEFDDNELWGGEYLYSFDVNVDLTTGLIKQLKKPVMVKEIN